MTPDFAQAFASLTDTTRVDTLESVPNEPARRKMPRRR
jgi:hypothetical protein